MTRDPPRLKHGSGPAQKLLRAADLDRPSPAARRRALSVAGAVTTLGATSVVAAASGGTALKGILFWVCVGAVGGGTAALAVSELVAPAAAVTTAARPPHATPETPPTAALVGELPVTPVPEPAPPAPSATPAVQSRPAVATKPRAPSAAAPSGSPAASTASFGHDGSSRSGLFEELRLIEAVRASVARGSPSSALAVLDAYDKAYPGGQFQPEAMALRVQALSQSGNRSAARALLGQLERSYPQHPLLTRARAAVEN